MDLGVCMYITVNGKVTTDLKESKEECMGRFEGRKGKGEMMLSYYVLKK